MTTKRKHFSAGTSSSVGISQSTGTIAIDLHGGKSVAADHSTSSFNRMLAFDREIRHLGVVTFLVTVHHAVGTFVDDRRGTEHRWFDALGDTVPLVAPRLFVISRLDVYIASAVAFENQNGDRKSRLTNVDRTIHDAETSFAVRNFQTFQSRCDESGDTTLVGVDLCRSKTGNGCAQRHSQGRGETVWRRICVHSAKFSHRLFDDATVGRSLHQSTDSADGQSKTSQTNEGVKMFLSTVFSLSGRSDAKVSLGRK